MIVEPLRIPDVLLIKPRVFRDHRGCFHESWRLTEYSRHGIGPFVQDNVSVSHAGSVRGMHFQLEPHAQGKLVSVPHGRVFDVAVDLRVGSASFGKWVGVELSGENGWQLWIPVGFAHGFASLTENAVFTYKCTDYYNPDSERTVRWNDPDVGVVWPIDNPMLAAKDAAAPLLSELRRDGLPRFRVHA